MIKKFFIPFLVITIISVVGISIINFGVPIPVKQQGKALNFIGGPPVGDDNKMDEFMTKGGSKKYLTSSEAKTKLPYNFKMPKNNLGKKLLGIYVLDQKNHPKTSVIYSGGLGFDVINDSPIDYEQYVEEARNAKERGELLVDTLPQIIEFNGHKAIGIEGGTSQIGSENYTWPSVVKWSENGLNYTIGGYGLKLVDLIEVAESFE